MLRRRSQSHFWTIPADIVGGVTQFGHNADGRLRRRARRRTNEQRLRGHMRAAWYEQQGPARDVLKVGTMTNPTPGAGEVRIRIAASGINPGDIKKRENAFGYGMPFPAQRWCGRCRSGGRK